MRLWIWLVLLLPVVGSANVVSPKPDAVGVTIYRASEEGNPDLGNPDTEAEGIALISEARELELPAGESVIEFVGVAQTIVPQSARLESLPGVIVETNFDYKLVSPSELISNSIGQSVRVVRTDESTGKVTEQRARLVSGPDGVLLDIDGKIEALDCSGAREKLVFDSVPENLRAKPVLSARVRVNKAGRHIVRLSYLAMGFDWSANYVARVQPDGRTLDLTGWVTLANKQDTGFADASVQVIAGNVTRDPDTTAVKVENTYVASACWPIGQLVFIPSSHATMMIMAPPPKPMLPIERKAMVFSDDLEELVVVKQRDLGDYKLYELPFKTELSARQVKQVMMIYNQQVPFEKIYTFTLAPGAMESDDDVPSIPANILIRLENKEDRGLGKPLPAGNVVVMEPDGEQFLVVGMNKIRDVAVGSPMDVEVGSASDVLVIPKITRQYEKKINRGDYKFAEMEVTLVNAQSAPAQFEFRVDTQSKNLSIVRESTAHIIHKGLPTWAVRIPSRSQRVVKYTLRMPTY